MLEVLCSFGLQVKRIHVAAGNSGPDGSDIIETDIPSSITESASTIEQERYNLWLMYKYWYLTYQYKELADQETAADNK